MFRSPDDVLELGQQRVAESLQDEGGEVDEIHLGGGEVRREFVGVWFVVQQLESVLSRGQIV